MDDKIYTDKYGLNYKYLYLEQYDHYDIEELFKRYGTYATRIGTLLISFSELEHSLDQAIYFLLNDRTDDIGAQFLINTKFGWKVDLFFRLSKSFLIAFDKSNLVAKLKEFKLDFEKFAYVRNKVAHAKWMSLDNDGYVRCSTDSYEGNARFKYFKLTPSVLYNYERKIDKLDAIFNEFLLNNNMA